MGKISLVSTKYIIHAFIEIEGVVERPDVIGSIFGQTEGLLGTDLELRELQRSGRIGRIEVDIEIKNGKTKGNIDIPSSMDKTETALIAAALETIQRIGPCNASVKVNKLEDIRISKRSQVIQRAKTLLNDLTHGVLPDSRGIKDEVSDSVKMMDAGVYGKDRLPAGPDIDNADEVIVVEGRADVLNLLKSGIKNCIALNGTSVPKTIVELSKKKSLTVFVDGDRGGDLILRGLQGVAIVKYATKAADGKEVEEITDKEIHQALRKKIPFDQAIREIKNGQDKADARTRSTRTYERRRPSNSRDSYSGTRERRPSFRSRDGMRTTTRTRTPSLKKADANNFKSLLEDLVGTHGAYILDKDAKILGKVPMTELEATMEGLGQTYAIVVDGAITRSMVDIAERSRVSFLVGAESEVPSRGARVRIVTKADL